MLRKAMGVVGGFAAWLIVWVGIEAVLSGVWPDGYGAHQRAFTAAIKTGAAFTPDAVILVIHVVIAMAVACLSGFWAAWLSRENQRVPMILGILLFALAILKAAMTWSLVPVWYHVAFTMVLLPMALIGGKLCGWPRSKSPDRQDSSTSTAQSVSGPNR